MKRNLIGISTLIVTITLAFYLLNRIGIKNVATSSCGQYKLGQSTNDLIKERLEKKRDKDISDKLKFDNPDIYADYHLGIRKRESENYPGYPQGNKVDQLGIAKSNTSYLSKRALRTSSLEWKERGPSNVPGRTRAILALPHDPQQAWLAGSVGGGIWKTEDGGSTWQNKTPNLPSLAISWMSLCDSQPEIVYASTGEAIGGSVGLSGSGIFKSIDGGESWEQLDSTKDNPEFNTINRIIVNPDDPDVVLFCFSNGVWESGFKSGIYKSIDGGQSWDKVYESDSWILQIIANPANFNTIYAPKWANGVMKSVDGGETWFDSSVGMNKIYGRVELTIASSDTSRLYGAAQGDLSGSGADLYVSYDAGVNWSFVNQKFNDQSIDFFRGQGDYDNTIAVNPFNENEVYYGGVNLWRTRMNDGESEVLLPVITFKVSADTSSYWEFINFGANYNNGRLELGENLMEEEKVDIEVRSGFGKHQFAHRFTVDKKGSGVPDSEYFYQDYVDIPFEVWDLSNDRQLMVSFRDQQEDSVFNLINTNTDDSNTANHSREYFYIHSVAYDENPDSSIAQQGGDNLGHQYKLLYFFWPVLRGGYGWDGEHVKEDTIKIDYDVVPVKERSGTMTPVSDAYEDYENLNGAYTDTNVLFGFHPDHHNLVMIPVSVNDKTFMILNSNDGGVYVSDTDTVPGTKDGSWTFVGNGYNTGQFYSASKKPGAHQYMGGLQDNGTWRSPLEEEASSSTAYEALYGGDGFDVLWNYTEPNKQLISLYQNRFLRTENNGRTWLNSYDGISGISPFFSKLATNNSNPNTVFTVSSDGVFKSKDFGESWILTQIPKGWGFSNFIDIKVSLSNHKIIWAGSGMSENLNMHVSTNGGETFISTINYDGVELGFISGLATHPFEDSTAYVLFSFAKGPKILRTTDLGESWEDISGFGQNGVSDNGFPDVAVYSLLVRPDNPAILWAGTEIGIFESGNNGESWTFLDGGLGAAAVWEMNVMDDQVVIATHGRGIFTATLSEVQDVVLVPEIVAAGTDANGDFIISLDFKFAYDSSFVTLNSHTEKIFDDTEKGIYTSVFESLQADDTINVTLFCYKNGKKYEAESLLSSHFEINDPVEVYIQDFNSGTDDFTGRGFEVTGYSGFNDYAIHSMHPYEEGEKFADNQINYIYNLKTPIIVSGGNSKIEYEDVALIETGEIGSRSGQVEFYDYVVLEGSIDGLNWKSIGDGYDAKKVDKWEIAYGNESVGDNSMFVKQSVELTNYFAPKDTILLRFRLFSDPLTVGWGWAIDNLAIQVPITGITSSEEWGGGKIRIYPNPANELANVDYTIQKESFVRVIMMDVRGNIIFQEPLGNKIAGKYNYRISTNTLRSGLYIIQLCVDDNIHAVKLQVN